MVTEGARRNIPRNFQARLKGSTRTSCVAGRTLHLSLTGPRDRGIWRTGMKIVVLGGTGLIGQKLTTLLRERGHEVVAAAPCTGVNTVTREGLAEVMDGTQVVVDVVNAPPGSAEDVQAFFETSSRNVLAAEAAAGVGHHILLSIVGSDRNPENAYLCAKWAQEQRVAGSEIPFTIVRSTQFHEFVAGIAQASAEGDEVRLSPALVQTIAAADVAAALADVAVTQPANGVLEIAGPEQVPLDELARRLFAATGDARNVIPDVHARYFGCLLDDQSLTPGSGAHLGTTCFDTWLNQSHARA